LYERKKGDGRRRDRGRRGEQSFSEPEIGKVRRNTKNVGIVEHLVGVDPPAAMTNKD
jgi:hypothetical protein